MRDYQAKHPGRLATKAQWKCEIIGNVTIDENAEVDPTAKIGPNVAIGAGVKVGPGVRISNSIILDGSELKDNSLINYSIIGWNSSIGLWTRIEGSPVTSSCEPLAQENKVTIFGAGVKAASEIIIRDCIVLPHKELSHSIANQIIL